MDKMSLVDDLFDISVFMNSATIRVKDPNIDVWGHLGQCLYRIKDALEKEFPEKGGYVIFVLQEGSPPIVI